MAEGDRIDGAAPLEGINQGGTNPTAKLIASVIVEDAAGNPVVKTDAGGGGGGVTPGTGLTYDTQIDRIIFAPHIIAPARSVSMVVSVGPVRVQTTTMNSILLDQEGFSWDAGAGNELREITITGLTAQASALVTTMTQI